MLRTLSFIAKHPLTRRNPLAGMARFVKWQIQSRLRPEIEVDWIGGAKLLVSNGMAGATGNIYCGLHEFADMGFLLHLLRPEDLFMDIGANIGSYTVLASAVVGAETIAAEPDPGTIRALRRNIQINRIEGRVTTVEAAIGDAPGTARFTVGLDSTNHVATPGYPRTREVAVRTLDDLTRKRAPTFIKLDVEGFEDAVIAGATATLEMPSLLALATESDSDAVVAPLKAAGFVRLYYDPFNRSLASTPNHSQSNALFIRNVDFVKARLRGAPSHTVLGVRL